MNTYRNPIELTGNLIVHHTVKETSPADLAYTCDCSGCWACKGQEVDCTCDVDWDKVYGHE